MYTLLSVLIVCIPLYLAVFKFRHHKNLTEREEDSNERRMIRAELRDEIHILRVDISTLKNRVDTCEEERNEYKQSMLQSAGEQRLLLQHFKMLEELNSRQDRTITMLTNRLGE